MLFVFAVVALPMDPTLYGYFDQETYEIPAVVEPAVVEPASDPGVVSHPLEKSPATKRRNRQPDGRPKSSRAKQAGKDKMPLTGQRKGKLGVFKLPKEPQSPNEDDFQPRASTSILDQPIVQPASNLDQQRVQQSDSDEDWELVDPQ